MSYPIPISGSNIDDSGAQGLGFWDCNLIGGQGKDRAAGVLDDIDGHSGCGHSGRRQTVIGSHPQL